MLRDERRDRSLVYWPPRSLPLYEQVDLLQRIAVARATRSTWDEIAEAEGVPKRTLQHFYRSSIDGPRIHNHKRRSRSVR
jgi:hypothetical protein